MRCWCLLLPQPCCNLCRCCYPPLTISERASVAQSVKDLHEQKEAVARREAQLASLQAALQRPSFWRSETGGAGGAVFELIDLATEPESATTLTLLEGLLAARRIGKHCWFGCRRRHRRPPRATAAAANCTLDAIEVTSSAFFYVFIVAPAGILSHGSCMYCVPVP